MREPRGREVWSGYAPNSATDRVLGLCAELIDRHTLRSPMPLVVLRAAREHPAPGESEGVADEAVEDAVKFIHRAHRPRGLLCRVIGPGSRPSDAGDDAYARTAAVLADLTSQAWENDKLPRARPYAFPRSRLLAAIEEAVSLDDDRSVLERLDRMRWRPRPSRADGEGWLPRFLRVTLSPAGVVGAILTAGLGALAGQAKGQGMAVALAAAVLLVAGLAVHSWSRHHEGLLPWHDPSGRWLSTTTFLAASGTDPATWSTWRPRLSRAARDARAGEIAHAVGLARGPVPSPERDRARQFHLQLRALALLEDLRADHRPRLGVRPRGRAVPPVVFIPRATDANGGIALLRAISDVRSRRSELDPLLVVAGIARADEDGLDSRASAADPVGTLPDPRRLYQAWVEDHLRVGQSPSIDSGLPWVLPVRLAPVLLRTAGTEAHVMRRIGPGPWAQLGRRLTAVTAVLAALGGSLAYVHYHPFDCEGAPFTGETTAFRTGDGWECVGVTDGSITFATSGPRLGVRRQAHAKARRTLTSRRCRRRSLRKTGRWPTRSTSPSSTPTNCRGCPATQARTTAP